MASSSLVPSIIVLALGAGALGFPDAFRLLLDIAGRRDPLTDIAICFLAIAVVATQALRAMLLARFFRKAAARAGGDAQAPSASPPRTDHFAQVTLVVSLGVAFLVSACLLVAPGAGPVADIAMKMKSPVVAALATAAAAVLPCARTLLRVFCREEDHSHGAAASSSVWTERFASMIQAASFTGAATSFLLAMSGGLYAQRGSLAGVATVVGTVLLARFTYARKARNAAGAGARAAPSFAADTRRDDGKLTRLAPYLAVVSFAVICCVVLT